MPEVSKKRVLIAALIGGSIFCIVVLIFDYILGRGIRWERLAFYFPFAVVVYGYLSYRNFKKQQKK
ncbi:hypothetical protein ES711_14335 [Gelidibacter salicanalis]|uniref:Uncharacterized protein n=1 Tax=Gelidibacter salicanalis TaxID=291193 RepID=A0A5C7ABK9_9FLAO|nr:hypothetical protein [Gelidibacter salicanalis]TXE06006.1 hypothetical protein ES711_14335 [Gelidibacter salicanalis]